MQYFALHPYVFLVRGAWRYALYDLYGERLLPLENDLGDPLVSYADAPRPVGDKLELLSAIEKLGFGRFLSQDRIASYQKVGLIQPSWLAHDLKRLSLSWSLLLRNNKNTIDRLKQWKRRFLLEALYFIHEEQPKEVEEWLKPLTQDYRNIHVLCPDIKKQKHISLGKARIVYSRLKTPRKHVSPSDFSIAFETFPHLRNFSTMAHTLHIGEDGNVTPCFHEPDLVLGNIHDQSLELIIQSESCQKLWALTKDKVTKCKDCEFRFACLNPPFFRETPETITSTPRNCHYQLQTGQWK
jgi:radical SAM protein with 4Fe4S-binding SPASM domain